MTAAPVLGDFLRAAHRHLDDPAPQPGTAAPGRDVEAVTGSLSKFLTVTGRYAADVGTAFSEMPVDVRREHRAWSDAAAETLTAVSAAALALVPDSVMAIQPPQGGAACPQARRLDAATASLTVGRDLVQVHFAPGRHSRVYRSGWAPAIASSAVSTALLADLTALTGRAAAMVARMPAMHGRGATATTAARRLNLASQWLARAEAIGEAAQAREPGPVVYRDLLYAIPATAVPARRIPGTDANVPALCEAIITAAERARHAAWLAAEADRESPAICVTSWRRIAISGVAASRHCRLTLTVLAERAAQLGGEETNFRLRIAAGGTQPAYKAWVHSARELGEVTTDVRWPMSRAAGEAADLALLTGRLAYASPDWNLSSGPGQRLRAGADLAPAAGDLPEVLAAVHHAADSFARLARANHHQARAAVRAGRVLVPARSPDAALDAAESFVRPSGERTLSFVNSCRDVQAATARTAGSVGEIAVAMRASSRVLAAARAAVGPERRRARLAFEEAELQAAGRLDSGGGPARPHDRPAKSVRDRQLPGPFEARLREIGITGQRFLGRAASIDWTGQKVIAEAAAEALRQRGEPADPVRSAGPGRLSRHHSVRRPSAVASPQHELEAEP